MKNEIVALQRPIESRLGRVNEVNAKTLSRTDEQARVEVHLKSAQVSERLDVTLVWNGAEWKVVQSAFP